MIDNGEKVRAFLAAATLEPGDIDRFLDRTEPNWARFDADLGYVPNDSDVADGYDSATSRYRYGALGERLVINHGGDPCRINTYGDSFTQCHQVSDGETWQEYLAAHLGEPIRNFGVGGYGVYQAALRLRRIQASAGASKNVVLNVFLDDHYRNLDAYRLLRVGPEWWQRQRTLPVGMFHANPWRHVRFDASGQLIERPNLCPTPESLYRLCDTEFVLDAFGDDPVVGLLVAEQTGDFSFIDGQAELAQALGVPLDISTPAASATSARQLYARCAFQSSIQIIQRTHEELAKRDQRLLVLLSYPDDELARVCGGGQRTDATFVRQLEQLGIAFVDGLAAHLRDFEAFAVTPTEYVNRYYYGHYTPAGNHFFAMSVARRPIVEWLDPRPPSYLGHPERTDAGRIAPARPT